MSHLERQPGTIGILGGMGPAATVEFFRRLVASTPAAIDQAHLRILIDNNPGVPDRTRAIFGRGDDPGPALAEMAKGLEASGADLLTMPCNTGHAFKDAICAAVRIPFVDMIQETAAAVDVPAVGLLSTTGTIRSALYHTACDARGLRLVVPEADDQQLVMDIIARVKAGGMGPAATEDFYKLLAQHTQAIVERLAERGAEAVIAGCTEISLIPSTAMPIPWVDALDCLVQAAIRDAGI